jgi:single-strand DNA-binding protein
MEAKVKKPATKKGSNLRKRASRKASPNISKSQEKVVDHSRNTVLLRGRISALAGERTLPSGDKVSEFRLIVNRSAGDGVDTLEVAAWKSVLRNRAAKLKPNDWVEVSGEIRRRFWRGAAGLASRWQIEASEIKVLSDSVRHEKSCYGERKGLYGA